MKNLIILFILLLSAKNFGQTKGISYQAVILNAKGEQLPGVNNVNAPLANSDICMLFKLFDEYSKLEYQEVVQIKTDQFGMVNLIIGGGVQTGGYALSFDTVVWDSLKKTLVVSINTDGSCSTFSEISNQPLNYVPFAYSATNATNVTGVVAITNGGTNATSLLGAKINFGIDKVDNTSDLDKPLSIAAVNELSFKENLSNKSTSFITDGASDVKYPSVKSVKDYVDASGTSGSTALATEVSRATTAEATLTTNLATETTRATTAEGTLTTNLASEITRATTAEASKEALVNKSTSVSTDGTSDTKYPSVKSVKDYVDASATSGSTALATEVSRATTAEATLTTNLVTETTRATTAEGTLTTNLASEITRATTAEASKEALVNKSTSVSSDGTSDTKYPSVKSVKDYVDASATSGSTALATEVSRATTAEASKEDASNKSTDGTFTSNSDVKFPTEKATKTYADAIAISTTVALTNELNRATAAESALAANLAIEASNRINADVTKAPLNSPAFTGTVTGVTSAMVGLGNVNNTSDLNKPVSNATQTALDLKASIASLDLKAPLNSPVFTGTVTGVTSAMVGLGNVNNTSDLSKPVSTDTQTALDLKAPLNSPAFTGTVTGVTSAMIGLGNVDNTSDLNKPVSNATQTALDLKASIASLDLKAPLNSPAFTGTVTGVTSTMVGLGNVNNTSDLNKPVSNATQTALDLKASIASLDLKAPLNSPAFTGTVTGVTSAMVGLGNVDNTSDLNKPVSIDTQTALDLKASINSPAFTGTVTGVTSTMVGLGNVNNTSDLNKPVSTDTQTALDLKASIASLDLKAPLNSPAFTGTVTGLTSAMVGLGNVDNTSDLNKPVSTATQAALDLIASTTNLALKAPLNSPAFTGVPIAPTAIIGTNTTQIATTAYVTATLALAVREVADEFNATATQTSFTLSQIPSLNSKVKMYVNGVRISNTAYSVVGSTLVYVPANNGSYALSINDRIQFDYFY